MTSMLDFQPVSYITDKFDTHTHQFLLCSGVDGFSLSSSSSSEDGQVTVCPGTTTVTLTCTASQVGTMGWMDQNGMIVTFNVEEASRVVHHGPYTVTLVAVDNRDGFGTRGDFNSTLVVTVDDGFENGTDITCKVFGNQDHLLIYKKR